MRIIGKNNILPITLLVTLLSIFVFWPIFFGEKILGDAPFLSSELMNGLVNEPSVWEYRDNNFGSVSNILWISPLMILYGALHTFLGLSNNQILIILFYIPSIALASITPIILSRHLGFSNGKSIIVSVTYVLNTYFALLLDGGQVGIALAYGFLPLAIWSIHKYINFPNFSNFYLAVVILFIEGVFDPRFVILSFIFVFLLYFIKLLLGREKINSLKYLLSITIIFILLSSYWIFPLINMKNSDLSVNVSNLHLSSMLHTFFLYQPHWPMNKFGEITYPSFYFVIFPIFAFILMPFVKKQESYIYAIIVLVFIFLAKGSAPPFGEIYDWILQEIPFGASFRDSTKFYPLIALLYGFLISEFLSTIHIKVKFIPKNLIFIGYITYILFLISPVFLGKLNGNLKPIIVEHSNLVLSTVNSKIFERTLWLPEKSIIAYHSTYKQALDAKDLVKLRMFASINIGTYDRLNFLNNTIAPDLLQLSGIKYLNFLGDEYIKTLNKEDLEDWNKKRSLLEKYVGSKSTLESNSYILSSPKPNIYSTNKLVAVVGSDDIYMKGKAVDPNNYLNVGYAFFEDGIFDYNVLVDAASESATIIFNGKNEIDLKLSFLQKYFTPVISSDKSEWALRKEDEYLGWKYDLLKLGIDSQEFDYNKGIAFSSVNGETIENKLSVKNSGKYVLAVRYIGKGEPLSLSFNNQTFSLISDHSNSFKWFINEDLEINSGIHNLLFKNNGGVKVLNVIALIPLDVWNTASDIEKELLTKYTVINDIKNIDFSNVKISEISVEDAGILRKKMTIPSNEWLIFTDTYHSKWQLTRGSELLPSFPVYSSFNAFYTDKGGNAVLRFKGQEDLRWGTWLSAVTFFILTSYFLWIKGNEKNS